MLIMNHNQKSLYIIFYFAYPILCKALHKLGRKNYLFAGSHEAAQRTAMVYSLLGSCKMQGVNPYLWLKDVLTRISIHPINKVKELLPHHWKQLQVQDVDTK